jgi:hypothetical protein
MLPLKNRTINWMIFFGKLRPSGIQFRMPGQVLKIEKQLLSELAENQKGICVGVKDTSSEFLKYLTNRNRFGFW